MGGTERLPLAVASVIAQDLVALLEPACDRIEVAGSIRRRGATVGDVEVVCIPRFDVREVEVVQADLFSEATTHQVRENALDMLCAGLLERGVLRYRLNAAGSKSWGSALKWGVYQHPTYGPFAVDIYSADPLTWGVLLAIRTGSAGFSKRLVTPRHQGGLCPNGLVFRGWRVRHITSLEPVETPEEPDVFAALGLEYLEPAARTDTVEPRRLAVA